MLNGRLISQIFGSLLFLEAILMAVCLPISLIYGQHDLWAFLITIAITVATGLGFRALGKGADNNMSRRDAYFVVTATWLLFSFFGMIPFLLCPLFAPPGDTMGRSPMPSSRPYRASPPRAQPSSTTWRLCRRGCSSGVR